MIAQAKVTPPGRKARSRTARIVNETLPNMSIRLYGEKVTVVSEPRFFFKLSVAHNTLLLYLHEIKEFVGTHITAEFKEPFEDGGDA